MRYFIGVLWYFAVTPVSPLILFVYRAFAPET